MLSGGGKGFTKMQQYAMRYHQPTHANERTPLQRTISTLDKSLTALVSAAVQLVAQPTRSSIPLTIQERFQSNARRAEESMRELRELGFARNLAATELSQSLTVMVLVADMVVSGHLTSHDALGSDSLFWRNATRAEACFEELRKSVGL